MKMKTLTVAAALFAASGASLAAAPTLSDVLGASGISMSGRIEAGYDYANTQGGGAVLGAPFTSESNAFSLHQAALNLAVAPTKGVGGAVTILAGQDAQFLNGAGSTNEFIPLQAYVSWTDGTNTVIGGRFLTLAGAEVIDSSANFNATRGIVFNLQPLYHNGVRASRKLSDNLSVTAGVMNSISPANAGDSANEHKTVELNTVYTMGSLTNALTVYAGDEASVNDAGRTLLVDYVGTLALNKATTLVLNADYFAEEVAKDDTADGYAVAGYVNQKLSDSCRVALRGEYVHATQPGVTFLPFAANAKSLTLTMGHTVAPGLEIMAEARADKADKGTFNTADSDSQYIGTIRAVYKFGS